MARISFHNVCVRFDEAEHDVLHNINLDLTELRIGIIGANGSGKSTLARLINGLGSPTSGTVTVDNLDVEKKGAAVRKRVGFIFSDAENQIIMPRVKEDIAFSLRKLRLSKEEKNTRVAAALARFGLSAHAEQSPHTLSGGQKQLLALAAVLVTNPDVIIADEPTTLLDLSNRLRIQEEFRQLEQQLIVVTHDLDLISDFHRVICIDNHRVVADGPAPDVIEFYTNLMKARH